MLEQVRKLFGYTQEDIAKKIGVTQNYYTQIETGASKSSPLIAKISNTLKIKESFLTSLGEYVEYPFLSDFYIFYLTERRIVQSYKFLIEYICSKSQFIDVVFFLSKNPNRKIFYPNPITYIALRDDRNTIFLLRRYVKIQSVTIKGMDHLREKKEIESRIFPLVDTFREELHKLNYVFEKTVRANDELSMKINDNIIKRDDIVVFFLSNEYFRYLYEAHTEVKNR